MQIELKRSTESDAVLTITCSCGNQRMLNESGDFPSEEVFVYRYGVPAMHLRCYAPAEVDLQRAAAGLTECRERYRVAAHGEHNRPYIEVTHVSPRPADQDLVTEKVGWPA